MNSQMIVHHPYRSLIALQPTFSLTPEESSLAWSIINDHYMTDLPLLYPPHIIAITAILLTLVLRPMGSGATPTVAPSPSNVATAAQAALAAANQQKSTPSMEKSGGQSRTKIQKLSSWLAESNVDIEAIIDCTQELTSFCDVHEQYNEKLTREQINRFVKARGLDK
jgi:cyclin-C